MRAVFVAPLRVVATDIECQGRKGHFPLADKDPVVQISCVVHVHVREEVIYAQHVIGNHRSRRRRRVDRKRTDTELVCFCGIGRPRRDHRLQH
mmetsp:Transcript_2176/g.5546  ORF Transcript_2176/g.5546 Transcript_2176/m.5546 type:complete len:93 (+) Transcript_2176:355-633(+)